MLDAGRDICSAVTIPVLADGDTGYGNAMNVKRTVKGYAATGFAAVMIEDQVAPKRCGHTKGKDVVGRAEAIQRVRAACDARDEGADILILARTDARTVLGMEEALERIRLFEECGADIIFLEAPESIEEMKMHCDAAPNTPKLANMLEGGKTPVLPPAELEALGYKIAAYPLTLLSRAVAAMNEALDDLKAGREVQGLLTFPELRDVVGFDDYYREEERYKQPEVGSAAGADAAAEAGAGDSPVSDWTEQFHDKSGSKFWFNPKTGESSWKMPEELRGD